QFFLVVFVRHMDIYRFGNNLFLNIEFNVAELEHRDIKKLLDDFKEKHPDLANFSNNRQYYIQSTTRILINGRTKPMDNRTREKDPTTVYDALNKYVFSDECSIAAIAESSSFVYLGLVKLKVVIADQHTLMSRRTSKAMPGCIPVPSSWKNQCTSFALTVTNMHQQLCKQKPCSNIYKCIKDYIKSLNPTQKKAVHLTKKVMKKWIVDGDTLEDFHKFMKKNGNYIVHTVDADYKIKNTEKFISREETVYNYVIKEGNPLHIELCFEPLKLKILHEKFRGRIRACSDCGEPLARNRKKMTCFNCSTMKENIVDPKLSMVKPLKNSIKDLHSRFIGGIDFETIQIKKAENLTIQQPIIVAGVIYDMVDKEVIWKKSILIKNDESVYEFLCEMNREFAYNRKKKNILHFKRQQDIVEKLQPKCHFCEQEFAMNDENKEQKIVIHHDHATGGIIGFAHQSCNISKCGPTHLHVYTFNGIRFDHSLILQQLLSSEKYNADQVKGIRKMNRFTTLKFRQLMFQDLLAMQCTGITLSDLYKVCKRKKIADQIFGSKIEEKWDMKWRFSMNFNNTDEYFSMKDERVPSSLYNQSVSAFELDYCMSDVAITIACAVSQYDEFFTDFGVNMMLSPTAPSLTNKLWIGRSEWGTKMTSSNYWKYQHSIRGGIVQVNRQFTVCQESEEIKYLDVNNLYGYAMLEDFPVIPSDQFKEIQSDTYRNFTQQLLAGISKKEKKEAKDRLDLQNYVDNLKNSGYTKQSFYRINVSWPPLLRSNRRLDALPPTCEKRAFDLSPEMQKRWENFNGDLKYPKVAKLVAHLQPITDYLVWQPMYDYIVECGAEVEITWKQEFICKPIYRDYILHNHSERLKRKASKDPSADNFKLMNNSLYGKQLEDTAKYTTKAIFDTEHESFNQNLSKHLKKGYLDEVKVFHGTIKEKYLQISFGLDPLETKQPWLGVAILDISKVVMYRHLDRLYSLHPKIELLYMDTDSFILLMPKHFSASELDLSDTDLGKLKDEAPSSMIKHCYALAPKQYILGDEHGEVIYKKAKGISDSANNDMTLQSYIDVLNGKSKFVQHNIFTLNSDTLGIEVQEGFKTFGTGVDTKRNWFIDSSRDDGCLVSSAY
ncbi:hypothetical protein QYM36_005375, partial [Artemia franciscana]